MFSAPIILLPAHRGSDSDDRTPWPNAGIR
jgi:hypothetical protein